MKKSACFLAFFLIALPAFGQLHPETANVNLYFPQFADGGSTAYRWQTTFVFLNPDPEKTADIELFPLNNSGAGLPLDFGAGASTYHRISVPPRGTRTMRSLASSTSLAVGWAIAQSSIPVQGTVFYREFVNGVPKQEIAAAPN